MSSPNPTPVLRRVLEKRFLTKLLSTPKGRAHVLRELAEAEDSDEAVIFDHILSQVEDEDLQKMIRIHRDDETRHGAAFRARLAATGVDLGPLPQELKLIPRLEKHLGGLFTDGPKGSGEILVAYLLLQVIEERAVSEFRHIEPAFRAVDPETADLLLTIGKDEERHLKYCRAISRRYSPHDLVRSATLKRLRELEAECFAANGRANLKYILSAGLIDLAPWERAMWQGIYRLGEHRKEPQFTEFWAAA